MTRCPAARDSDDPVTVIVVGPPGPCEPRPRAINSALAASPAPRRLRRRWAGPATEQTRDPRGRLAQAVAPVRLRVSLQKKKLKRGVELLCRKGVSKTVENEGSQSVRVSSGMFSVQELILLS